MYSHLPLMALLHFFIHHFQVGHMTCHPIASQVEYQIGKPFLEERAILELFGRPDDITHDAVDDLQEGIVVSRACTQLVRVAHSVLAFPLS